MQHSQLLQEVRKTVKYILITHHLSQAAVPKCSTVKKTYNLLNSINLNCVITVEINNPLINLLLILLLLHNLTKSVDERYDARICRIDTSLQILIDLLLLYTVCTHNVIGVLIDILIT